MVVNSETFLSDTIKFIRKFLEDNITDPLYPTTNRPNDERFVMTSYPQRQVSYPIITIKDRNMVSEKLGMRTVVEMLKMTIEVRVWARNIKERDTIGEQVYHKLRTLQYETSGLRANGLHDFVVTSMINLDDPGDNQTKSKVIEIKVMFITE